jgi:hypothetical protein
MDIRLPPGLSLPSMTLTTVPMTATHPTSLNRTRQRTDDTDINEREHKSLRIGLIAHVEKVGVLKRVTTANGQEFDATLNEEDDWINEANIPQTDEFPTDKLTEGIKNEVESLQNFDAFELNHLLINEYCQHAGFIAGKAILSKADWLFEVLSNCSLEPKQQQQPQH